MIPDIGQIRDLTPLTLADQPWFLDLMTANGRTGWVDFFPWLYGFTLSRKRTVLWERVDGALCLYLVRRIDEEPGLRMDLYFSPIPFSDAALRAARERCERFNGGGPGKIFVVDAASRPFIEAAGWRCKVFEREYVYDADLVRAARGKDFERLRRNLNLARRTPGLEIRDWRPDDRAACDALARAWEADLKGRESAAGARGTAYIRRCLRSAAEFDADALRGEVITLDGRIAAFTFGGPIGGPVGARTGALFVAIADRAAPRLTYLQRASFIDRNPDFRFINDSSDAGRDGLAEVKRAFNPARMNILYGATEIG